MLEFFFKKTLSLLLDFNIFKRIALKYIKIVIKIYYDYSFNNTVKIQWYILLI